MKIREDLIKNQETIKKLHETVVKCANNTEKYYWEVKQLREVVEALLVINKELTEQLTALIKQQIGD